MRFKQTYEGKHVQQIADNPTESTTTTPLPKGREVEVFYDGDCPLCLREINLLRRWDNRDRIAFTDIAEADFDPASIDRDMPTLMAEIHGRLPDGSLITGVEVFRRLYSAVGLGWLVAPTRLPGIRHGLDLAYRFFARNRLRFTGRCDDACRVNP